MTNTPQPPDRIPITHSVVYAVRGLPEVPNKHGAGTLEPREITLTYRAAPDSQLGRVHAYVAGRIWVNGAELPLLPGGLYGQHYDDGLDGWPEWLAEEARLHDPAVLPAVPVPPATHAGDEDQTDRLAQWLWDNCAEDERTGLLADDPRRIATVALHWPELRRMADEAQQQPDTETRDAFMRAHVALAEQAGQDQAILARVRRLYESGPLGTCCAHLVGAALSGPGRVADEEQQPTRCDHSFPDPFPASLDQIGDCRHCGISYQDAKRQSTAAEETDRG